MVLSLDVILKWKLELDNLQCGAAEELPVGCKMLLLYLQQIKQWSSDSW